MPLQLANGVTRFPLWQLLEHRQELGNPGLSNQNLPYATGKGVTLR